MGPMRGDPPYAGISVNADLTKRKREKQYLLRKELKINSGDVHVENILIKKG